MKDTSWNKVSKWYDKHVGGSGSDFHQEVILPRLLQLIDLKHSQKVLDIGCGQGVLSREMAKQGALVTGIDNAPKLIKIAKERSKNIDYRVMDASNLAGIKDNSFDMVTCLLALQNMKPIDKVIKEVGRILKAQGKFFIVLNHPCFRIPRQSGWGFDEKRKLQYRRVDRYLSEMEIPIQMHPGSQPDVFTLSFHRPLSTYFKLLGDNGLVVNILEEWTSHRKNLPGRNQKAENLSREEIPMFLCLGAVKCN